MKLERDFGTVTRRTRNKKKRMRGYRTFAAVVVGILLGSAGITALLGGGASEQEENFILEEPGTAADILAAIPMQGGAGNSGANFGATQLQEGEYTIIAQTADVIRQPATGQVSLEYFSDAAFLGDSLTEGFIDYSTNLGGALVCGYMGIGPNSVVNKTAVNHAERGEEIAIDVLAAAQPSKVYILLGTNTLVATGNDESFLKYYGAMIDLLYEALGEDTILYIQSVPPATVAAVADGKDGLASTRLQSINESLAQLAEEKGCVYLDLWEAFADADGNLNESLSAPDGIHFSAGNGYTTWVNYLRTHAVYRADNEWTAGSAFAG